MRACRCCQSSLAKAMRVTVLSTSFIASALHFPAKCTSKSGRAARTCG